MYLVKDGKYIVFGKRAFHLFEVYRQKQVRSLTKIKFDLPSRGLDHCLSIDGVQFDCPPSRKVAYFPIL